MHSDSSVVPDTNPAPAPIEVGVAPSADESACRFCQHTVLATQTFCPQCGFAQNGTTEQKIAFKKKLKKMRDDFEDSEVKAKKARNWLLFVGIFVAAIGLFFLLFLDDKLMGVVNIVLGGIYIGLMLWAKKSHASTFSAVLTGLILYVTSILFNAVLDPLTLLQGIILKVIIIAALVNGTIGALKSKQLREFLIKNPVMAKHINNLNV